MPRNNNFLLGSGERLTREVSIRRGGGDKYPPYTFHDAQKRIIGKLESATVAFDSIPADASPGNEVVAVLTMHPRYVSKSDFPQELLSAVGLRAVGSRSRTMAPDRWGTRKHPEFAVGEDLFVAGTKEAFKGWTAQLSNWTSHTRGAEQLSHVEDLAPFRGHDKLRGMPENRNKTGVLEVVLHNAKSQRIVDSFLRYARQHGAQPMSDRRRDVNGLTFVPVETKFNRAEELAEFSFLRVARPLPTLRPLPGPTRTAPASVKLPSSGPLSTEFRALVFDGGLPPEAVAALRQWVNYIEPSGIGPAAGWMQQHGLAVTAALLFGPIPLSGTPQVPVCAVDHVRVIDVHTTAGPDLDYIDVLDRITSYLDANLGKHSFINISLGPQLAMQDDEVTLWTASLDTRLASGRALTTVAAGNDGELDGDLGLNRVQPPADAVNVLAVGATDTRGAGWRRATYSCPGPGRTPGFVKPDGVAFGGSDREPFICLAASSDLRLSGTTGTSVASPIVLRSGTAVRAQLGTALMPLAIRALLIHRADPASHTPAEVGWGRFEEDPERLITCDDNEAIVVYQGRLPIGQHLRAPIPLPKDSLKGAFDLTATLVIGPEVDPEHPSSYTRSGLEVAFRPNSGRFRKYGDGTRSQHAKTRSFFSASNLRGAAEYVLREEGYKWEPCLRSSRRLRAEGLQNPCFDIYHHTREGTTPSMLPQPIPYALVVGMRARRVRDFYNRVVRTFSNILVPLQPVLRIPVRT